jgi:sporadic carbohydrate cluster 2OG-Fe(II) oxygenase
LQLTFLFSQDQALSESFLGDGHVVRPAEDADGLERIRSGAAELAATHLNVDTPKDPGAFLNGIHDAVSGEDLNALRLAVFNGLNAEPWFRPTYFALARTAIEALVGNELCMQRRINLSVQMPFDDSSLLPVHADVWDGDSPFEVVLWVPLVDCFDTKAMYLLAPEKNRTIQRDLAKFSDGSAEDIFEAIADDVEFIKIAYGEVMLFSQTLMHGNRVNVEPETRWSMNCRFKSVMSPYADKKLGEFFEPITLRAATRMGLDFEFPEGFHD